MHIACVHVRVRARYLMRLAPQSLAMQSPLLLCHREVLPLARQLSCCGHREHYDTATQSRQTAHLHQLERRRARIARRGEVDFELHHPIVVGIGVDEHLLDAPCRRWRSSRREISGDARRREVRRFEDMAPGPFAQDAVERSGLIPSSP